MHLRKGSIERRKQLRKATYTHQPTLHPQRTITTTKWNQAANPNDTHERLLDHGQKYPRTCQRSVSLTTPLISHTISQLAFGPWCQARSGGLGAPDVLRILRFHGLWYRSRLLQARYQRPHLGLQGGQGKDGRPWRDRRVQEAGINLFFSFDYILHQQPTNLPYSLSLSLLRPIRFFIST